MESFVARGRMGHPRLFGSMPGSGRAELAVLSNRERVVVSQIVMGVPLKVIACDLSISVSAISTHLRRAQDKLGAQSRVQLMALVVDYPSFLDRMRSIRYGHLSRAEVDVALAIVAGGSNASIAQARHTSIRTVENQVSGLFRKVGIASRYELIALALLPCVPIWASRLGPQANASAMPDADDPSSRFRT